MLEYVTYMHSSAVYQNTLWSYFHADNSVTASHMHLRRKPQEENQMGFLLKFTKGSGTLLVRLYKDAGTPSNECSHSSNSVMDHSLGKSKVTNIIWI